MVFERNNSTLPEIVDLKARLTWFIAWSNVEHNCACSWCSRPIDETHLPAVRVLSEDSKREARLHRNCFFHHALRSLQRAVLISLIEAFGPAENLSLKKRRPRTRKGH